MTRGLALPAAFTAVSLVILLALGGWQWRRMGEKEALLAQIQHRISQSPKGLPAEADWPRLSPPDLAYTPVTVTGTFQHADEAHVFFSLSKPVNGIGGPGYLVVTPFKLSGGGVILINRGFVPADRKLATTRSAGQIEGEISLSGLLRAPEARSSFSGTDDPAKNIFYVRDPARIAAAKGLGAVAPVMIDLRSPQPPGGLPLPAQTQVEIPNNHFGYALTWWSLAAALLAIFTIFAWGRRAEPRGGTDKPLP